MSALVLASAWSDPHPAWAAPQPAATLKPVVTSTGHPWNRVAVAPDGRVFVSSPDQPGALGAITGASVVPLPTASHDLGTIDGLTVADGALWVLDTDAQNGFRAVRVNLATDAVDHTVPFASQPADARLSGLAVHGDFAFTVDSVRAAIVVLNLKTGETNRFLEGAPGLVARHPVVVDGVTLHRPDGTIDMTNVSMLAVSPDGQWLYLQPPGGMLYRLATTLITDPLVTPIEQQEGLTLWQMTGALGGVAVDPHGTLYFSDLAHHAIKTFTTGRIPGTLLADPRLNSPANPAVGPDGTVFVPVTALTTPATTEILAISPPAP